MATGLTLLLACGAGNGTESITEPPPEGNEGTTFQIVVTEPPDGATAVETGAAIRAVFSAPVDPNTLTPATFGLALGSARVAGVVSYDAAARAGRLVAPLLPGQSYQALIGTELRSASGAALTQAHQWSFATRAWRATALDRTGVSVFFSSLAIDATGRRHVTFGSRARLLYSTCVAQCDDPGNWQTVAVEEGIGGVTSVAVDTEGRARELLRWRPGGSPLRGLRVRLHEG